MKKFLIPTLMFACITTVKPKTATKTYPHPKLVVVVVIDQFAHHYLRKLSPYLCDGFKFLLQQGTSYENAHHPHGAPSTAPGHAGIGTGTIPYDHGIILNGWIDERGNKITFGDDDDPKAALLSKNAAPGEGKSARHMLVETLSDRAILSSTAQRPFTVFSLSYKARAAIGMGGSKGNAIWFDAPSGQFTSSKTYFEKLPDWVEQFNKEHEISKLTSMTWNLRFDADSQAYNFPFINNREYATYTCKLAGNTFGINQQASCLSPDIDDADDFAEVHGPSLFLKTPAANKLLLDFAQTCLTQNFSQAGNGTFLLWVSLSSLDMLGHKYGPDSLEMIDMIYHLDQQLGDFIKFCQNQGGKRDTLFVLTADHGVEPIPEILQLKGLSLSRRIQAKPLMKKMNTYLQKKYGIEKAVAYFKVNQFYLNTKTVPAHEKPKILRILKKYLLKQQGIKKVWTRDELIASYYRPDQLECLFKNQCHPSRSGDLICMVQPFTTLTKHETGAAHRTPYNHDTHVPLIFYQEGYKPRTINTKVWVPQLPVTLAHIMGIPKPAAARYGRLP